MRSMKYGGSLEQADFKVTQEDYPNKAFQCVLDHRGPTFEG